MCGGSRRVDHLPLTERSEEFAVGQALRVTAGTGGESDQVDVDVCRERATPEDERLPSSVERLPLRDREETGGRPEVICRQISTTPRLKEAFAVCRRRRRRRFDQLEPESLPLGVVADCRLRQRHDGRHAGEVGSPEEVAGGFAVVTDQQHAICRDVLGQRGVGEKPELVAETLLQAPHERQISRRGDRD